MGTMHSKCVVHPVGRLQFVLLHVLEEAPCAAPVDVACVHVSFATLWMLTLCCCCAIGSSAGLNGLVALHSFKMIIVLIQLKLASHWGIHGNSSMKEAVLHITTSFMLLLHHDYILGS